MPKLAALGALPASKIFTTTYAQTPASVKRISEYAADQSSRIDLVEKVVPFVLAGLGVVLVLVGVALGLIIRRRRSPAG